MFDTKFNDINWFWYLNQWYSLGRPDSSVGKTVCLCLTTSYILFRRGVGLCWRHTSKKYRVPGEKTYQMKIPAECMSGLTVPAGLRWFDRVFLGQPRTTLPFLHLKTVVQNASLEAELLGWCRFRKIQRLMKTLVITVFPDEHICLFSNW